MMHTLSRFIAALLGLACCAGAFAQAGDTRQSFVGRTFWYEPEHEKYVRTEFHRVPDFDKGIFKLERKTQFEVLAVGRGWVRLRLEGTMHSDPIAYLPALIFRSRLYAPGITESYQQAFRKAAFFEEDPDIIRKRLEPKVDPVKKSAVPPPWKIRNRGLLPPEAPAAEPPVRQ